MNDAKFTAQVFIDAIPGTRGNVSEIARRVGCCWHIAKKYIDERPTVKQAYDDEVEASLDHTESKLNELIDSGNLGAIKFHLVMKGKHRGYVQQTEVTGPNGGDIVIKGYVCISPDDWPEPGAAH